VFPEANVARAVPAVTAACLLVDRQLYERVGGLSGAYVQGDYEDSDFCLRLLDAGRENWYLPDVELYHLEGQSYPDPVRRMNSEFNCWLHTYLWHEQIETAMARFATPVSV
jgi:O-antigen biosynthesis protein